MLPFSSEKVQSFGYWIFMPLSGLWYVCEADLFLFMKSPLGSDDDDDDDGFVSEGVI